MAEVSAIDVGGGAVEIRNRPGYCAGETGTDVKRDEFDNREKNCGGKQKGFDRCGELAGGGKQMIVESGCSGLDVDCRGIRILST